MAEKSLTQFRCTRCGAVSDSKDKGYGLTECSPSWLGAEHLFHKWVEIRATQDGIIYPTNDNIELSLLVIDMGDSCCVRVEKGEAPPMLYADGWYGKTFLCSRTFTDIRSAIDASYVIESPPLPRIERVPDTLNEGYRVFKLFNKPGPYLYETVIQGDRYDALCELAGVIIPVYEPKNRGEWTQLFPPLLCNFLEGSVPERAIQFRDLVDRIGVKIHRYTRMK